nr:cytochrome P450 2D20-like [Peromyscus maniculatus bairdii]
MALLIGDGLWSVVIFTAVFLLLVDLMYRRKFWTARYPPGPMPLPGLGNLLQVDFENMPYSLYKLRQRYGDVFSLQMAWKPVVVINGQMWAGTYEQYHDFLASLLLGHPFNPINLLNKGVCNVISSLIYAHRFEYEDPFLNKLLKILQESFGEDSGFIAEVLNAVPVLLRIPGLPGKAFPNTTALVNSLDKMLIDHKTSWDPAQPPRDLTDAFLAEMEKAKGNPESTFNDANLRMVVFDLFTAGMVTTSTTLYWALLLMILHPHVQSRVQQEIDEVIGQRRHPEMADQARMPYTNAVIHEVQRFADITPVNLPHMTSRDIEVQGFLIPKGTTLIPNLSSVLKDETVWEKPLQFHPEHFLDAQD